MNLTYGSACSGVESASLAWEPLGWKPQWFAEIEAFPSAVLAQRWPEIKNHGDMLKLPALILRGVITAPDVLVAGTPCQSFSIAGLRKGLDDNRGQLTIGYIRIADAVDYIRQRRGEPQTILTWENVPGVLSDSGNAFGCFLAGLVGAESELEPGPRPERGRSSKHWRWSKKTDSHIPIWGRAGCVVGPKRTVAWRLIDAQYFGVAQRRRRVFLVGSARAGFNPAKVLFESEGVRRDTPPSRERQKEIASSVAGSVKSPIKSGCRVSEQAIESLSRIKSPSHWDEPDAPPPTLSQSHSAGRIGASNQEVFSQRGAGLVLASGKETVGTLTASQGSKLWLGNQEAFSGDFHVIHGTQSPITNIELAHTLGRNNGQENAVAFAENSRGELRYVSGDGNITGTISTGGGKPGQGCPTILNYNQVRRLIPVETERLQGMPDNHTRIEWRNKSELDCPDGPRYKAIGNSKAVPCVEFIGIQIEKEISRLNMMEAA